MPRGSTKRAADPRSSESSSAITSFSPTWSLLPYPSRHEYIPWLLASMPDLQEETGSNSLGLDLQSLTIQDPPLPPQQQAVPVPDAGPISPSQPDGGAKEAVVSPTADQAEHEGSPDDKSSKGDSKRSANKDLLKKTTPYVNPDRVKTGGAQRVSSMHLNIVRIS